MRRFRFRPWMLLAALLVVLVLAFFGTFFATGGTEPGVTDVMGSAAAPAVAGAHGFGASVKDFFARLFGLRDVDKEYEQMRTQIQVLQAENELLKDAVAENERLNALLGFEDQYPTFQYVPAHVIGKNPGSWFLTITLNRGWAQGIEMDMVVVNEKGLVGRVIEVGRSWCKVQAIIDRQAAVPGIVQHSLDNCMVHGSGDPQGANVVCGIYHLSPNSAIVPGDVIVTSDVGGIYPKGFIVGTVTEVDQDKTKDSFARIVPAVDFAHIDYVLIIKGDRHVPTESEIAAEASATPGAQPSPAPGTQPDEQPTIPPESRQETTPGATTGGGN